MQVEVAKGRAMPDGEITSQRQSDGSYLYRLYLPGRWCLTGTAGDMRRIGTKIAVTLMSNNEKL